MQCSLGNWATVTLGDWFIVTLGVWAIVSLGEWFIVSLGVWGNLTPRKDTKKGHQREARAPHSGSSNCSKGSSKNQS